MDIKVPAGKYIMAVSGGVDSMALLDILANKTGVELVVAHFNHNMRQDSFLDEELVSSAAAKYSLPYEADTAKAGEIRSEESARAARYTFLERIRAKHSADAIMTAHHQDDKVETALLNVIRGTGRKGLSAISDNKKVLRPLLNISKAELYEYAKKHRLEWREDHTNTDTSYLRNYVRLKIVPKISDENKEKLISKIDKVAKTNTYIDIDIATISQHIYNDQHIDRQRYSQLPNNVGRELLAFWLRAEKIDDFDKKTINRLSNAIKTAKAGSRQPIKDNYYLEIGQESALFSHSLQKL